MGNYRRKEIGTSTSIISNYTVINSMVCNHNTYVADYVCGNGHLEKKKVEIISSYHIIYVNDFL